jgi:hypothetical protein
LLTDTAITAQVLGLERAVHPPARGVHRTGESPDAGEYRLLANLSGLVNGDIVSTVIEQHKPKRSSALDPEGFM